MKIFTVSNSNFKIRKIYLHKFLYSICDIVFLLKQSINKSFSRKMSKRDLTIMPDEAKVTDDVDCVLLNSYHSYCSQLTNLAACEKGLKWRRMQIDIKK